MAQPRGRVERRCAWWGASVPGPSRGAGAGSPRRPVFPSRFDQELPEPSGLRWLPGERDEGLRCCSRSRHILRAQPEAPPRMGPMRSPTNPPTNPEATCSSSCMSPVSGPRATPTPKPTRTPKRVPTRTETPMIIPRADIQRMHRKTMTNKGTTTIWGPTSSPLPGEARSSHVEACL